MVGGGIAPSTVDIGVDFGTTRTVVAACDRGNYPVVGFQLPGGETLDWYPSLVAEREGVLAFGFDALAMLHDDRATVVRSFKRLLSDPHISPSSEVEIGARRIGVVDLVAGFLSSLHLDLFERSNLPRARAGALRAVIATPANAHSTQRFITLEAFRRAGFEVAAMMNEPSAAGVEYAHRYRNTLNSKRDHILVYDLGGGTFDASLVRMSGKEHDVVASTGLSKLGGDDFDRLLAEMALESRGLELASLPARGQVRLLEQCRDAKERLNPSSRKLSIDLGEEQPVVVAVDRYYERCAPLVAETIRVAQRALAAAGKDLQGAEVAGVYVVGGASSLPVIARLLKEEYGRRVHRSAYPSAATAIGLAIALDERAGFELTERFSHHFGVFREDRDGTVVAFDPIFAERAVSPRLGGDAHVTSRTYRAVHNVGHFRYIECGWLDDDGTPAGDITPFAEVYFPFDPALRGRDLREVEVRRLGEGPVVEERYAVHPGGIVELTIRDLDTGFEERHRLG